MNTAYKFNSFALIINGILLIIAILCDYSSMPIIAFFTGVSLSSWIASKCAKRMYNCHIDQTARIVTMANDELARFNKQILLSPKDFDYHVMYWPCTKNTVVTEGKEYMWYGIKKNDTFVTIGGYRDKVVSMGGNKHV